MKRLAVATALLLTAGCAHYPVNPKLTDAKPDYGYRYINTAAPNGDDTFVIVTMSGGGTRAAALAYGVMEKLAETKIRGDATLLSTVDTISSVSGGSFTAAWYALHGPERLPEFKDKFLYQNIQKGLILSAFANPVNLFRLLSPKFSRIDVAAEYYDKHVFDGATYASLPHGKLPYTTLNATEMDLGSQFQFTQEQFDTICSDLNGVKIARAAASSSAFPGLLTPITFRNYAGQKCGYTPPEWFGQAAQDMLSNAWRQKFQSDLAALMNPQRTFLHLVDGGIADNIGLRTSLYAIKSQDTLQPGNTGYSILRLINQRKIKRVAVIVVNAKTQNQLKLDRKEGTPSLLTVLGNVSNTPLGNYSFDTVAMLNDTFAQRTRDAQTAQQLGVADFPQVKYYPIEVAFRFIQPPDNPETFLTMATSFYLPPDQIDELIRIGKVLLDQSAAFQQLVKDLQ